MLADNIVHFSRILRDTGLAVGPDRVLAAIAAVEAVGLERREDIRAALSAVMLERHEQQTVFDAAFDAFFRDPKLLEQMMYLLLPKIQGRGEKQLPPRANRLAEALAPPAPERKPNPANETAKEEIQFETEFSFSERERLAQADFESMTTAEYELAKKLAERAPLPVHPVRRRRHETGPRGTLDLRRTLQGMARQPHTLAPAFTHPRTELPPIVVLLDISGSMDRYSRLLLQFIHTVENDMAKVEAFVFGTRLTRVTRLLKRRSIDEAFTRVSKEVQDWAGGTRIGESIQTFNQEYARRVLRNGAVVLVISDGWDRGDPALLGNEMMRLQRSSYRLIWLNPLLGSPRYQPLTRGMQAALPYIDDFMAVHNMESLELLAQHLSDISDVRPVRKQAPLEFVAERLKTV